MKEPKGIRARYLAYLNKRRAAAEKVLRENLFPELERLSNIAEQERGGVRLDTARDELKKLFERIRALWSGLYPAGATREQAEGVARALSDYHAGENQKQMLALFGIPIIQKEQFLGPLEQGFIEDNIDLIQSLDRAGIDEVERVVSAGLRKGLRVEQIRGEILQKTQATKAKASLLARDQTLKFYGELTEHRQRNAGVDSYEWDTSGDERVRSDHAALNGTIQKWSKPPIVDQRTGRRAHPGGDYQCRCQAIPIIPEFAKST